VFVLTFVIHTGRIQPVFCLAKMESVVGNRLRIPNKSKVIAVSISVFAFTIGLLLAASPLFFYRSSGLSQNKPQDVLSTVPAPVTVTSKRDMRDPQVILAESTVNGISTYTIPTMIAFRLKFITWLRANPDVELEKSSLAFGAKLAELQEYVAELRKNPDLGEMTKEDSPEIKRLYELVAAANIPMFEFMRGVIARDEKK